MEQNIVSFKNIIFKSQQREFTIEGNEMEWFFTANKYFKHKGNEQYQIIEIDARRSISCFIRLYTRIKLLGLIIFSSLLIFRGTLKIPELSGFYKNLGRNYTIEKSKLDFERTTAKRLQIAVVYATQIPLKIIGEEPYDYFDTFTGKFKQTKHFSQIIWSYNDLGILGLLSVIILSFCLIESLGLKFESKLLLVLIFTTYLFMTNVYSDLVMMFWLLLIKENRILSNSTVKTAG